MNQPSQTDMERGNGPEPAPQAAYRSKMWGLIDGEFSEDEDSSDIIADDEQSNEMPSHPIPLKQAEQPLNYCPGGLHPVHLWDSLDCGRYKVIHKLGYETSSTIWLARDSNHDVYVAIKILMAKASKYRNELGCLHYLSKKPSTHPGRKYVAASFLDRHFWLRGPNGRHLALVSKVSGPSVSQMTGWHIRIRERLARKIARQVTQGLAYLHSEGICHGNLTASSVLFQLANFDSWSEEKVYEQLGQPAVFDLCGDVWSREPSTPEYLVGSAEFFRAGPGLLTEDISIISYDDSFRVKIPKALSTDEEKVSNGFAAPEILFGLKNKFPSDLWALGCIIYQICAGQPLFPCSVNVSPAEAVREIVDTIENLPTVFAGIKFDEDGFPNKRGHKLKMEHSSRCLLGGLVANIEVEREVVDAISPSDADTELYELKEAQSNPLVVALRNGQYRAHVKADPNLFWKPFPRTGLTYIDCLYQNSEETDNEELIGKMARPLAKIPPEEAEDLLDLLSSVLRYTPDTRQQAAKLVKNPWFSGYSGQLAS